MLAKGRMEKEALEDIRHAIGEYFEAVNGFARKAVGRELKIPV